MIVVQDFERLPAIERFNRKRNLHFPLLRAIWLMSIWYALSQSIPSPSLARDQVENEKDAPINNDIARDKILIDRLRVGTAGRHVLAHHENLYLSC